MSYLLASTVNDRKKRKMVRCMHRHVFDHNKPTDVPALQDVIRNPLFCTLFLFPFPLPQNPSGACTSCWPKEPEYTSFLCPWILLQTMIIGNFSLVTLLYCFLSPFDCFHILPPWQTRDWGLVWALLQIMQNRDLGARSRRIFIAESAEWRWVLNYLSREGFWCFLLSQHFQLASLGLSLSADFGESPFLHS